MQDEERVAKRNGLHAPTGASSSRRNIDNGKRIKYKMQKQKQYRDKISSPAVHHLPAAASLPGGNSNSRNTTTTTVSPTSFSSSTCISSCSSSSDSTSTSLPSSSDCVSSSSSSSSSSHCDISDISEHISSRVPPSSSSSSPPETSEEVKTFSSLGLCEELCVSVKSLGWTSPTPIQRSVLPVALQRRDIVALAETGSGKTAAFALPILQQLLEKAHQHHTAGIFSLILAPTRELSLQISQHFLALGTPVGCRVATIVGGLDHHSQTLALARKPHVIVGTPGRILDHLQQTKGFSLKSIQVLVLDEADRLLSLDFDTTLQELLQHVGHISERQTMLFSATMTTKVSKLQRTSLKNPVKVCLHGKMTQPQRIGALTKFRAAHASCLVATEVGSRGLDIPQVEAVINFDVPLSSKEYIHRVGRTARAGRSGRALTIVTQYDVEAYQRIEHALGKKLEELSEVATPEKVMPLHEKVLEALRSAELEAREEEETVLVQKAAKAKRKKNLKK